MSSQSSLTRRVRSTEQARQGAFVSRQQHGEITSSRSLRISCAIERMADCGIRAVECRAWPMSGRQHKGTTSFSWTGTDAAPGWKRCDCV